QGVRAATGAQAAQQLRRDLRLGDHEPIQSVVDVLEKAGIRVMELRTRLAVDAMAGQLGDEDVVVLKPDVPGDRTRLNAAHELGHVVFRDCAELRAGDAGEQERRAFEFASHFLLTRRMLKEAFQGRSMVRLVQFKERYGISLAAMVYRAQAEAVLPKSLAKRLWIEFSRRGWRSREPGQVAEERATRFEQIIDAAILSGRLSWHQAAAVTGMREDELRDRVEEALGPTHQPSTQRKGGPFPKLAD
ncbi:hypothetical protein LCGC14_1846910, partial [marine sediment metagenome]